MSREKARTYWNHEAAIRMLEERQRKSGRFGELYEFCCWHYIEPLLAQIGAGRILEAGCGPGRWVFRLAPMGYCLELLDLAEEMIRHAAERVKQKGLEDSVLAYHTLDICDMWSLPAGRFDLVLALGVPLSLCERPEQAVAEFARVVRPGGYVVCDFGNRYRRTLDLFDRAKLAESVSALEGQRDDLHRGVSLCHFAPRELTSLFRAQGLEPLHLAAVCPLFGFPHSEEHAQMLEDERTFEAVRETFLHYAEVPEVINLSGRLLLVAQAVK